MADQTPQMDVSRAPRREVWIIAILAIAAALFYRYQAIPDDPAAALRMASERVGLPVANVGPWFSGWTSGDGQVFAAIAADPLGLDEASRLLQPAYRLARAGFGWVAWIASLGREQWVPYGLAIVGLLTLVLSVMLAIRMRAEVGVSAWLIALNPALFLAFAGDTAEGLGCLLLAYTLTRGWVWSSVALGVVRPTYLAAMIGRWREFGWGLLTAGLMSFFLLFRFGWDLTQYGGRLGPPLIGYFETPTIPGIAVALLAAATLVRGIRHRDWGWVASAVMVLCFRGDVLGAAYNVIRASGLLFVLWALGPGFRTSSGPRGVTRPGRDVPVIKGCG